MAKIGADRGSKANGKRNGAHATGGGGAFADFAPPRRGRPQAAPFAPGTLGPNGVGVAEMFAPGIDPSERIADWVTATIERGPIDRIRLTQKVAGGEQAIAEWDREELEGLDAASIGQMVYLRALEDVDGSGALSRFVVLAYQPGRGSNSGAPTSRVWFRLAPEDLDSVAESEDPSTPAGMLSQSWRHNEAFAKLALSSAVEGQRLLSRELARVTDQCERFESRHVEMIIARETLADRSAVRALAVRQGEAQLARSEKHKSLAEALVMWGVGLGAAHVGIPLPPAIVAAFAPQGKAAAQQSQPQQTQQPTAGQPPQDPTRLHFAPEQLGRLNRVTAAVLRVLTDTPERVLDFMLARLDQGDREAVKTARAQAIMRIESTAQGGEKRQATEQETHEMLAFQGVLCGLLGGGMLDDATVGALLAQLPPEAAGDAASLRETIIAMRTPQPAPAAAKGATS